MKVLRKDTNVNPEMDDHELIFGDLANVFDEGAPGPSNSIIQPVSDPHIGLENGLPSLEEFCHTLPKDAIPKDAVDTVFNMLGEEGDRHFLTNLLQTTENDLPPISQMCPESTNNGKNTFISFNSAIFIIPAILQLINPLDPMLLLSQWKLNKVNIKW